MEMTFTEVAWIVWVLFILYWAVAARSSPSSAERREALSSRLAYLLLLGVSISLLVFAPPFYGPLLSRFVPDGVGAGLTGLAILMLGTGLAVRARQHLGQYWSARITLEEGHQLIQTGPYHLVRHPIYLGGLIGVIGTAIVIGEVRGLLSAAFVLAVVALKIRTEEAFLGERFGPAYRQYQRKVKALIPFVF
jgi:protein-S-isoprenylcysteine O-methyltransferase Ste14